MMIGLKQEPNKVKKPRIFFKFQKFDKCENITLETFLSVLGLSCFPLSSIRRKKKIESVLEFERRKAVVDQADSRL